MTTRFGFAKCFAAAALTLACTAFGQAGPPPPRPTEGPSSSQPPPSSPPATSVESPPPAPLLTAPPAPDPVAACVPDCRPGYTCVSGGCVSACNPPCPSSLVCSRERTCLTQLEAAEQEDLAPSAAAEGLHFGAVVGAEGGYAPVRKDNGWGSRVVLGAMANFRLVGHLDFRASLGALAGWAAQSSSRAEQYYDGFFDLDVRVLLSSRFAMGIGGRIALGSHDSAGDITSTFGARFIFASIRLGHERHLELNFIATYQHSDFEEFYGGGIGFAYLFF